MSNKSISVKSDKDNRLSIITGALPKGINLNVVYTNENEASVEFVEEPVVAIKQELTKEGIEKLGWIYTGRTTELWFGIDNVDIQPFNLTYRSFRLSYNLTDKRLQIVGFEYTGYSPKYVEEVLFLGKIEWHEDLEVLMGWIGIKNIKVSKDGR